MDGEHADTQSAPFIPVAREFLDASARLAAMRPPQDVRSTTHGLPVVLRALSDHEDRPLSPSELARLAHVSDARIANMLRSLEERGFVERRAADGDRRRVEVRLTAAGKEEHDRKVQQVLDIVSGFLGELGEHDSRELVRLLGRVADIFERRQEESAFPFDGHRRRGRGAADAQDPKEA